MERGLRKARSEREKEQNGERVRRAKEGRVERQ
jgi:hypothetical protein